MFARWRWLRVTTGLSLANAGAWERSAADAAHSRLVTWGNAVTFICFVETETSSVPYMEPMPVDTLEEARAHARRLLEDHRAARAAHIFNGDEPLETLTP